MTPVTFVAKIFPEGERAEKVFDQNQWYILVYDDGLFNVYNFVEDIPPTVTTPDVDHIFFGGNNEQV